MNATVKYVLAGLGALVLVSLIASGMTLLVARSVLAPQPVLAVGAPDRGGYVNGNGGSVLVEGKEVALPKFVTNLADTGGAVDVTFVLVVRSEKDAAKVEKAKNQLRDAILGLLRTKRVAELTGPGGKDKLAESVATRVNDLLGSGMIAKVLVPDMVTQP